MIAKGERCIDIMLVEATENLACRGRAGLGGKDEACGKDR
jgi:hypothetical protein